jgi:hypothetical protein
MADGPETDLNKPEELIKKTRIDAKLLYTRMANPKILRN